MSSRLFPGMILAVLAQCSSPQAGELTIVPFAVPVAVPVAVVQQPTLFYGISHYAPPAAAIPLTPGPAPARGEGSSSGAVDPVLLRDRVDAVLLKRCAECHHADRPQGDLALFDAAGKPLEKLPRQLIVDATAPEPVGTSQMPPGPREKLTDQEWETLKQWARMPKSFVY